MQHLHVALGRERVDVVLDVRELVHELVARPLELVLELVAFPAQLQLAVVEQVVDLLHPRERGLHRAQVLGRDAEAVREQEVDALLDVLGVRLQLHELLRARELHVRLGLDELRPLASLAPTQAGLGLAMLQWAQKGIQTTPQ